MSKKVAFLIALLLMISGCASKAGSPEIENHYYKDYISAILVERVKRENTNNDKKYNIANSNYRSVKKNACSAYDNINDVSGKSSSYYLYHDNKNILHFYKLANNKCHELTALHGVSALASDYVVNRDHIYFNIVGLNKDISGLWMYANGTLSLLSTYQYFGYFAINPIDNNVLSFEPNDKKSYLKLYSMDGINISELSLNNDTKYTNFFFDGNKVHMIRQKEVNGEKGASDLIIDSYPIETLFEDLNSNILQTRVIEKFNRPISTSLIKDNLILLSGGHQDNSVFSSLVCNIDFDKCKNYEKTVIVNSKYLLVESSATKTISLLKFDTNEYEVLLNYTDNYSIVSSDNNSLVLKVGRGNSRKDFKIIKYTFKKE